MQFNITPLSDSIVQSIKHKIDSKTKPLGALGMLETIALKVARIQETDSPSLKNPTLVVFAGDHGIAKEGQVNPYPQSVTAQMVYNFLEGGAAINSFCKQNSIDLKIVDAGVNHNFKNAPGLIDAKIEYGTRNYQQGPAMQLDQGYAAIAKGATIVSTIYKTGCNCIGFGEMGIGNTSSAALLMAAFTGIPIKDCVGAGTGLSSSGIAQKKEILARVFKGCTATSPIEKLAYFGGFEIAMMTGAFLRAAELKMTVLVDGFIASSALLVAHALHKNVLDYCIFMHNSGEQGHHKILEYFRQNAILDLGMRLGEGTGAAVAFPILQSAIGFLNDMASFETAQIDNPM
ncbi:nicotinate-nucleotide--dimethylbenzimidazole phosphoribosyltransferase [Flagellimonas algicola]|uniref:Nicotinate-nucleotide--dimethylbenzimidazole phosphoribosyltransferase n=1 Tax=Flagellimonas algicola TaxID=2583815 RepID=A0ABY2WRR1_9FLAO|nr:nicotinate-nucleotide--dimethylbenzimidazole phosphoribosyltransferase [Allomuricauda algicola]